MFKQLNPHLHNGLSGCFIINMTKFTKMVQHQNFPHPNKPECVSKKHSCSKMEREVLLASHFRILFHKIWNSTNPRRALPSFWRSMEELERTTKQELVLDSELWGIRLPSMKNVISHKVEGYIQEVHHSPAWLHTEAICYQVFVWVNEIQLLL